MALWKSESPHWLNHWNLPPHWHTIQIMHFWVSERITLKSWQLRIFSSQIPRNPRIWKEAKHTAGLRVDLYLLQYCKMECMSLLRTASWWPFYSSASRETTLILKASSCFLSGPKIQRDRIESTLNAKEYQGPTLLDRINVSLCLEKTKSVI